MRGFGGVSSVGLGRASERRAVRVFVRDGIVGQEAQLGQVFLRAFVVVAMDLPEVVGFEQDQEVAEQGLQRDDGVVAEFGPGQRLGMGG